METAKVKDFMVPAEKYPSVGEEATLYDVLAVLTRSSGESCEKAMPYRAVFVKDKNGRILGKLGYLDVMRALEPRYAEMGDIGKLAGHGLSAAFVGSMLDKYELWKLPLTDLCRKASEVKAGRLVASPPDGEIIDAGASLNRAVHQFVVTHLQSLLVVSNNEIVGILRSYDVFLEVAARISACKL